MNSFFVSCQMKQFIESGQNKIHNKAKQEKVQFQFHKQRFAAIWSDETIYKGNYTNEV